MRIGTFGGYWQGACLALGHEPVALTERSSLPAAHGQEALAVRLGLAEQVRAQLEAGGSAEFLIDSNAAGLLPVRDGDSAVLLHEKLGVPLASHIVDPILACLDYMPGGVLMPALLARSWHKFVFDKAQAAELAAFGVPCVRHLTQAAPDPGPGCVYSTVPLDLGAIERPVVFAGSQSTAYLAPSSVHRGEHLMPALLAMARHADDPRATFFDSYFRAFALAPPPAAGDALAVLAQKLSGYYAAKLPYIAMLWNAQRNRHVLFLHKHLGEDFRVYGGRWESLGIEAAPPVPGYQGLLDLFRRCLININLQNGNTESGLNQRTFEITAAGGFMLCGHTPELEECFVVGEECESFRTEAELLEKIRYYRAHPARAAEIAIAGQRRTLREHLFSHRLAGVIGALGVSPGVARAPGVPASC